MNIVAYGGTALTFIGLKDSSEDIDLIVESDEQTREQVQAFLHAQTGTRIDVSPKGRIDPFYELPSDYKQRSTELEELNRKLKNIKLFAMDPLDVLVSKIGRFDDDDEKDAKRIIHLRKYPLIIIGTRFGPFLQGYQKDKEALQKRFAEFELFYQDEFGAHKESSPGV